MNSVKQKIFPPKHGFPTTINIRQVSQRHAGDAVQHLTMRKPQSPGATIPIGIAYHVSDQGKVQFIALANADTVFHIAFNDKADIFDKKFLSLLKAGGGYLGDDDPELYTLVGFSMARTAVQVHHAVRRQRVQGVEVATLSTNRGDSVRASPAEVVADSLSNAANRWEITRLWLEDENSVVENVCLQAWLAACIGQKHNAKLEESVKVNTDFLAGLELECIAAMVIQSDLIERQKPNVSSNEFATVTLNKDGKAEITNSRYKTRVRRNANAQVIMQNKSGNEYIGNAQRSKGKRTTINLYGSHSAIGEVTHVRVVGRPEPTNSERARDELLHLLLIGHKTLCHSPFIRAVWIPQCKALKPKDPTVVLSSEFVDDITAEMKLNDSQRRVVRGMVGDMPILVAHGPPGTGKTTTIAAASRIWDIAEQCVWIVTHSNVAVKNIGQTLFKKDVDFKLLISKEFFEEWHEHLYEEILQRVIRSDELPEEAGDMERMIGSSRIILCTLSMLSNPALHNNGTFKIVPVERLIIDEASQINIFEFLPIFEKFQRYLRKVCFFGDPEQLPPFGKDQVPTIRTIFDLPHIVNSSNDFFLDTQYRMPVPLGNFISKAMYRNRLRSQHDITDPQCIKFINVSPPRAQEMRSGFSWTNAEEVITIVHLVKHYYKNTNFCVITPYDAQRAAIERALRAENLPWESVYNLDSFQGNEADYMLISVVRTGSQPGFLTSRKRMNVLLTRCRKATIVVTSQIFMALGGAQTLLGDMLSFWQEVLNASGIWVEWSLVAEGRVHLPGAPGPNAARHRESEMRYLDNASTTNHPSTSIPMVPIAYRGPSGGFCVSTLFKARPKPSITTYTRPIQPTSIPNQPTSISNQSTSIPNPPTSSWTYEQTFPPLPSPGQPILDRTWQLGSITSTTVPKHSFLYKDSKVRNLRKSETLPPSLHLLQSAWSIPRAPISSPVGDDRARHEFDMAYPNMKMETNIYSRRR